jgi:hypothetical protein
VQDDSNYPIKQNPNKSKPSKPNLKLVGKAPPKLHLGAAPPSEDIRPAEYLVKCVNAWIEPWKNIWRLVWQFQIVDGPHHGVGIRKWTPLDPHGEVPIKGELARACAIALDRELDESDDLNNPGAIFAGKQFIVFIGYRKSERPGGGGRCLDEFAMRKKDAGDELRVHEIRQLVKL